MKRFLFSFAFVIFIADIESLIQQPRSED